MEDISKQAPEDDNIIQYSNKKSSIFIFAAAAVIVIVMIVCILNVYNKSITYSEYDVVQSVIRQDTESAQYVRYANGYIRYSNDGAAYYDLSGNPVWNQTYEMTDAQIRICEGYIAIGNLRGSTVYIFNRNGLVNIIDTALTITGIDVARQGVFAVSLEDGEVNYINLYTAQGDKISSIKTTLSGDGYPLAMALSEDGYKLAVSYVSVNGEQLETNIAFYNFSDVGKNEVGRLVGGFNQYGDSIVAKVEFVDNNTLIAVGEDVISTYSISQYPELVAEVAIEEEIQKIFYSSSYIGLIFNNNDSEEKYRLEVYSLNGNKEYEMTYGEEYRNFEFSDDYILMYNEKEFLYMTVKGKVKYLGTFDMSIEKLIPLDSKQKFIMVNSKYVQEIRLR